MNTIYMKSRVVEEILQDLVVFEKKISIILCVFFVLFKIYIKTCLSAVHAIILRLDLCPIQLSLKMAVCIAQTCVRCVNFK